MSTHVWLSTSGCPSAFLETLLRYYARCVCMSWCVKQICIHRPWLLVAQLVIHGVCFQWKDIGLVLWLFFFIFDFHIFTTEAQETVHAIWARHFLYNNMAKHFLYSTFSTQSRQRTKLPLTVDDSVSKLSWTEVVQQTDIQHPPLDIWPTSKLLAQGHIFKYCTLVLWQFNIMKQDFNILLIFQKNFKCLNLSLLAKQFLCVIPQYF